jgi:hypothetical protein
VALDKEAGWNGRSIQQDEKQFQVLSIFFQMIVSRDIQLYIYKGKYLFKRMDKADCYVKKYYIYYIHDAGLFKQ